MADGSRVRPPAWNADIGPGWTTYELRHSFVSLVSSQLDDLVKVADLAGHVDTRTTQGYRHAVVAALPHAVEAWNRLLPSDGRTGCERGS